MATRSVSITKGDKTTYAQIIADRKYNRKMKDLRHKISYEMGPKFYKILISDAEKAIIDKLDTRFFGRAHSIRIAFEVPKHLQDLPWTNMRWGGYDVNLSLLGIPGFDSIAVIVPNYFAERKGCIRIYDVKKMWSDYNWPRQKAAEQFFDRVQEMVNDLMQMEADHRQIIEEIKTALEPIRTTGSLKKRWPEIYEDFIKECCLEEKTNKAINLPTVHVGSLTELIQQTIAEKEKANEGTKEVAA